MLWSILNWRILREDEIGSYYEKMVSNINVTSHRSWQEMCIRDRPPDRTGNKQKRQQQGAAHKRGDSYNNTHEDACAIPDGVIRFHC